jgi:hypothetical protein
LSSIDRGVQSLRKRNETQTRADATQAGQAGSSGPAATPPAAPPASTAVEPEVIALLRDTMAVPLHNGDSINPEDYYRKRDAVFKKADSLATE